MTDSNDFFFSICIPAYNRAYTINRCLDSLIKQTYKNFEVIFVDDGSTDNTENIVHEYYDKLHLRYFKKNNGGKHTALNVGIKNAGNSELFMILDSDDWLKPDALEFFYLTWEQIKSKKNNYCGIMARCADQNEKLLGPLFKTDSFSIDYVTFHFGGIDYGDCNECIKTSIIKNYEFPEPKNTKFIPEYYIFDQIGVKYKIFGTNRITQNKEYSEDGITKNVLEYMKKNWIGYFYANICRLEKVVPYAGNRITPKQVFTLWYEYWRFCYFDKEKNVKRIIHISLIGYLAKTKFQLKRILVALSIKKEI